MRLLLSFTVSLMLLGCQAQQDGSSANGELQAYADVNVEQAAGLIEEDAVVVLDVRTDREYNSGHIEGARQLDFYGDQFRTKLENLPKDQSYLVYCASGNRSGQAVKMMKKLGFEEAHNLRGGMGAWKGQSKKTVR